ncbi:hypothetical protein C5E45_16335 [Nocardia nova]|uniref:Uncharacterized protein n=1 Tax=Nocardia nova TaxID=37330 RepID=A0A2S6APL2_9NOCA|nr:hypothetical protein [Nocardia nova]PPJ27831.1 hypothetical protein C5E41_14505 [Nocardia nova]PPJ37217.1 hypothetical protein C5E45_16335 [Nocardia nova]
MHGEVFNENGKTDFLLTWEGDNAFIGECKIWNGPRISAKRSIDCSRYVTWRDIKAPLVLFVKSGVPTNIPAKAEAEITQHTCYVMSKPAGSGSRRDYVRRTPTDTSRQIDLALVLVVISSGNGPASR